MLDLISFSIIIRKSTKNFFFLTFHIIKQPPMFSFLPLLLLVLFQHVGTTHTIKKTTANLELGAVMDNITANLDFLRAIN